jgi:hypothetical protein
MSLMSQLLLQVFYYALVLVLGLVIVGFMQRGFFGAFARVKLSFGRLILVKVRAVNRDYFRVGKIDEGFLVYKHQKQEKRLAIKSNNVFYRSLNVMWVDVEETKNAIANPDYTNTPGYDAVKYNDLYLRALYRPVIADNKEKLVIAGLLFCVIGLIVIGVLLFYTYKETSALKTLIVNTCGATVTPG